MQQPVSQGANPLSAPAEASATAGISPRVVERENSGGIARMGESLINGGGSSSSGGGGGAIADGAASQDHVARLEANSPALTIFLLVNTMIGAGILNMPQVFRKAGIFMGLCGFVATAAATWLGLNLLIMLGERMGVMDYGAIARKHGSTFCFLYT